MSEARVPSGYAEFCRRGVDAAPISGRGELSQEFLEELYLGLDNYYACFRGSWRQFATLLLNCNDKQLKEFQRRARYDDRNSPTKLVYDAFRIKWPNVDIGILWTILHEVMGREDLALLMVQFNTENRLLHQPGGSSSYDDADAGGNAGHNANVGRGADYAANAGGGADYDAITGAMFHSMATSPPQEGSDVCSTVQDSSLHRRSVRELDTLRVTAKTIIIESPRMILGMGPSTETTSLGSSGSSSGSSSSLSRDSMDSFDQPKMVKIPRGSSYLGNSGQRYTDLKVVPRRKETVLISYADHDQPKALDISVHLRLQGYEAVLDSRVNMPDSSRKKKCQQIYSKACAVVVIYSNFYKQEITAKRGNGRNTRFVYKLLKEEFERNHRNQRCVFYPMYQVHAGSKIPRIFNHLPIETGAALVHSTLFVPIRRQTPRPNGPAGAEQGASESLSV